MSDRLKGILSLVASLALGAGLLWLALRHADLEAVGVALAQGEWIWMVPYIITGLISVAIRAWRWGLLVDALPERTARTPIRDTSASVVIGYLVNYAAPRLGEVARAAHLSRRTSAPFAGVFGTVVAERVLDVIGLAAVLLSVAILFGDRVTGLLQTAAGGALDMLGAVPVWLLVVLSIVGVASLVGGAVLIRRGRSRFASLLEAFRGGLVSVARTGRPGSVVLSTVLLWLTYGLMADLPLRLLGLDEAFGLGLVDAWAVMAIGGIGMAIPSPGGTGSFHYATVQALTLLFAVGATPAATYALLVHAAGVVFYCILGVLALAATGTTFKGITGAARRVA
ncbi:lysylphosphatidylglycerol synthase transmembrane domain-containing protein [Rubrivirga sp.]|uniref:lysylphosphatidylglycerol synthase transmembrane domain-containing protein n=1 Tax=Rubrivirga sp. TaxID=1885344 RepID=UPI003C71056E